MMQQSDYQENRRPKEMRIRSFIVQNVGTYNQMAMRPYVSQVGTEEVNQISNMIDQLKPNRITAGLFSGFNTNLIAPSANIAGYVPIENGWDTNRCRFILIVDVRHNVGSLMSYFYQGYTSHMGIGMNNSLDPQMTFFINSFTVTRHVQRMTSTGMVESEEIVSSSHLLSNHSWAANNIGGDGYLLRPMDIFTGMQTRDQVNPGLYAEVSNDEMPNSWTSPLNDYRSMYGRLPKSSSRANDVGPSYVARIVDSYIASQDLIDYDGSTQDLYDQTKQQLVENDVIINPFLSTLASNYGTSAKDSFNYNDLLKIDPGVDHVKQILTVGQTHQNQLHFAGQSEFWHGADRTTVAATMISNAVPAIMLELTITKIAFNVTNHGPGGQIVSRIVGGKGLANIDMTQIFEQFMRRIENEVVFDITNRNQESIMLNVMADIFGDTTVEISFGSDPMTRFVTPSFCDGLMVPVISNDASAYAGLVNDFSGLMENVSQARNSARGATRFQF